MENIHISRILWESNLNNNFGRWAYEVYQNEENNDTFYELDKVVEHLKEYKDKFIRFDVHPSLPHYEINWHGESRHESSLPGVIYNEYTRKDLKKKDQEYILKELKSGYTRRKEKLETWKLERRIHEIQS